MNCLIIDDDPLVQSTLSRLLKKDSRINYLFQATDGIEGINVWNKKREEIDFIILDIELPEMSGIDILESLDEKPPVIMISSKENYGPEAFDHECIDYLLKPIPLQRLLKAVNRVEKAIQIRDKSPISDKILIKSNNTHINLAYSEILFIESEENYVRFYTKTGCHMVHATLKSVNESLPKEQFYKVQRSIIANISNIKRIRGNILEFESDKQRLERTTTKKEELLTFLPVLNKK
ncbi:LytTR family DNA-binding domain-containing protein [Halosquirtibacter laminarini]|uniref:LytTR family DNA-binding domain-containing protein n=1 Tax=Halosquirtibacter laminarini TaxID=3374600 RepID=A0AC61NJS3_9BACT|nr:LytTR family DNA-binding domain-containing protein [Prolixibacteraceae bacterium]